jgi:hypothetical protein
MTSRSILRPPPRRWWPARSIVAVVCVIGLALTLGASQAAAYPCGEPRPSRALSVVAKEECPRPTLTVQAKRRADFASLAVFVGLVSLALIVPVPYSRRRSADRE